jgi:hypothetical protein
MDETCISETISIDLIVHTKAEYQMIINQHNLFSNVIDLKDDLDVKYFLR